MAVNLTDDEKVDSPYSVEWLWVTDRTGGAWEVASVPLYSNRVNYGDIVRVRTKLDGQLEIAEVTKRSPFFKIRFFNSNLNAKEETSVTELLCNMSCVVEKDGTTGLVAVAVPNANALLVRQILTEAERDGMIKLEYVVE